MVLRVAILVVIACISLGSFARAQDRASEVRALIAREAASLRAKRLQPVADLLVLHVVKAEGARMALQLQEGVTYALAAACDQACNHIEMSLHDKNGAVLVKSPEANRVVIISGPAPYSGGFEITIGIPGCSSDGCTIGVGLFQGEAAVSPQVGDKPGQNLSTLTEQNVEYVVNNFMPGAQLNLRKEPDPQSSILIALDVGSRGLLATGESRLYEDQRWIKVRVHGLTGWVNARFVHAADQADGSAKRQVVADPPRPRSGGSRCANQEPSCSSARNFCIRNCRERLTSPRCSVDCQQAFQLCRRTGSWSTSYCQRSGLARN